MPSFSVINAPVSVDAPPSLPGSAAITGYRFDFGDGSTPVTGTAPTAAHTYTATGTYTVTTTAIDASDVNGSTTATDGRERGQRGKGDAASAHAKGSPVG